MRIVARKGFSGHVTFDGSGHLRRIRVVVATLPDVVAADEAVPLVVAHAVVASVPGSLHVKRAVRRETFAVPVHGFVVAIDDATERLTNRELDRVTVARRCRPAKEVVVEH